MKCNLLCSCVGISCAAAAVPAQWTARIALARDKATEHIAADKTQCTTTACVCVTVVDGSCNLPIPYLDNTTSSPQQVV